MYVIATIKSFFQTFYLSCMQVTAAITTVEDALGLPAPHQLAAEKEGDREGEGEGSKEEGEEESGEGNEGKVKTLAKLAEGT